MTHRQIMARRCWQACFILIITAMMLPDSLQGNVSARGVQRDDVRYEGVDLVFLVDQSGSMGGSPKHPEANDPDDRRFEIARFAIDFLAQLRYNYASLSDQPWDARVSVVYFGGQDPPAGSVETILENLAVSPASKEQWLSPWAKAEPTLTPATFRGANPGRNLGNTDFRLGFAEARRQLELMQQAGQGPRMRAIIVVSDGAPAPTCAGQGSSESCENPIEHMRRLKGDLAEFFNGANDRLYVIALNDTEPYWTGGPGQPAFGPLWDGIVQGRGFTELVVRNSDVTQTVQRAINDVLKPIICVPASTLGCPVQVTDTVKVLPYLSQVTFIVHKLQVSDQIAFTNGSGPIEIKPEWRENADKLVETITIPEPEAGKWRVIRPDGRDVAIFKYDVLKLGFQLLLPQDISQLGCGRPSTMGVRFIRADTNQPASELAAYPIKKQLDIRWPGGFQAIDIVGAGDQPDTFAQRVVLEGQGKDVPVWLRATTADPDGQEMVLYDNQVGVLSTSGCRYDWISPPSARLDEYAILTPTLGLIDGQGRTLPLSVPGEYEITPVVTATVAGMPVQLPSGLLADGRGAWIEIQPTQCGDMTFNVSLKARDLKEPGNLEHVVYASPPQTMLIDCKTLVRLVVKSAHPSTPIPACDLLGSPTALDWDAQISDEHGRQLAPQDVLSQPGDPPFVATVTDGRDQRTIKSQAFDSAWHMDDLSPGIYGLQIDFADGIKPNYIKDSRTIPYVTTLNLVRPDKVVTARAAISAVLAMIVIAAFWLFYRFVIRPRFGPVPQEKLILAPLALLKPFPNAAKVPIPLEPIKRQVISSDAYPALREFADELIVDQHPTLWERIEITVVKNKLSGSKLPLTMFGTTHLENRTPTMQGAQLEYKIKNHEEAKNAFQAKQAADRRSFYRFLFLVLIAAVIVSSAFWVAAPIGC